MLVVLGGPGACCISLDGLESLLAHGVHGAPVTFRAARVWSTYRVAKVIATKPKCIVEGLTGQRLEIDDVADLRDSETLHIVLDRGAYALARPGGEVVSRAEGIVRLLPSDPFGAAKMLPPLYTALEVRNPIVRETAQAQSAAAASTPVARDTGAARDALPKLRALLGASDDEVTADGATILLSMRAAQRLDEILRNAKR